MQDSPLLDSSLPPAVRKQKGVGEGGAAAGGEQSCIVTKFVALTYSNKRREKRKEYKAVEVKSPQGSIFIDIEDLLL